MLTVGNHNSKQFSNNFQSISKRNPGIEKIQNIFFYVHGEKKTVESTDVICWNRDSSIFL